MVGFHEEDKVREEVVVSLNLVVGAKKSPDALAVSADLDHKIKSHEQKILKDLLRQKRSGTRETRNCDRTGHGKWKVYL